MTGARRGFALMTVLWVMVGASVLALSGALAAREGVEAASFRIQYEQATWRAYDCLERARAAIDELLASAQRDDATLEVWRGLDRVVSLAGPLAAPGCDARLEAAGARLDANAASEWQLRALFRAMLLPNADALAARLLDWRDADDDPRTNGAEREWYARQLRVGPRNGSIADVRELALIPGFEMPAAFDNVLGTEGGRISVNHAPLPVLAAVPGFTEDVIARIAIERESGRHVLDVMALGASVSRPSADSIVENFPDISLLTTVNPDAWIIVARGWSGKSGVAREPVAVVRGRLLLDIGRAVMVSRRSAQ